MTCWRRLAACNDAGVWVRSRRLLLTELRSKSRLDWDRADFTHVRPHQWLRLTRAKWPAVRSVHSACEGEVVQAGDAAYGVVHAVAPETAVAEALVSLHTGEGVLDADSDPLV